MRYTTCRSSRPSFSPSEHETEVWRCLQKGAQKVQIDFTEGQLAMKLDPSGMLLNSFIDLNNLALSRFSDADRQRIGLHSCPGGDRDSVDDEGDGWNRPPMASW